MNIFISKDNERRVILDNSNDTIYDIMKVVPSAVWDRYYKYWSFGIEDWVWVRDKLNKLAIDYLCDNSVLEEALINYENWRTHMIQTKDNEEYESLLNVNLYKHQKSAINFFINGGRLIFDEMRLGKSLVLLEYIEYLKQCNEIKNCLIICPKNVIWVWVNELKKFLSTDYNDYVTVFDFKNKSYDKSKSVFYTVVNYEYFRMNGELYRDRFDCVILDEGHKIRNRTSLISKSIIDILVDVKYKLISTGTPFEKMEQLWALLHFIMPISFNSYWKFQAKYCVVENKLLWGSKRHIKIITNYKNQEEFEKRIAPLFIRRKKEDCFDLPTRVFQSLYVELDKEERKVYTDLYNSFNTVEKEEKKRSLVRLLMSLSSLQALGINSEKSSKIDSLNDFLIDLDLYNRKGKVIIWSSYIGTIKLLEKRLSQYKPAVLYGEVAKNIDKIIDKFKNNNKCKLFIANPAVGGMGLDLCNADVMIYLDCPISYTDYLQSVERNRGKQQTESMLVIYMRVKGTVDDNIENSYANKQSLYEYLIDGGD